MGVLSCCAVAVCLRVHCGVVDVGEPLTSRGSRLLPLPSHGVALGRAGCFAPGAGLWRSVVASSGPPLSLKAVGGRLLEGRRKLTYVDISGSSVRTHFLVVVTH